MGPRQVPRMPMPKSGPGYKAGAWIGRVTLQSICSLIWWWKFDLKAALRYIRSGLDNGVAYQRAQNGGIQSPFWTVS